MSLQPLILAPTDAGIPDVPGLRLGPDRILEQLALSRARGNGLVWDVRRLDVSSVRSPKSEVRSQGDQEGAGAGGNFLRGGGMGGGDEARLGDDAIAVARVVTEAVAAVTAGGQVPLVAGGDHTVTAGSVPGVRRGLRQHLGRDVPIYLLWLDAHPDANTPETSPSGNLHGMALAGLLGAGPLALDAPLPPDQVVLAGVRDLDPGERAFLAARPDIQRWDVSALRGDGWQPLLAALLWKVECSAGRLYVSLDLDVIDPAVAPGVAVPVPGGAFPSEVLTLLDRVRRSGLLAGADVVELHPAADRNGQTAALAAQALLILAGHAASATVPRRLSSEGESRAAASVQWPSQRPRKRPSREAAVAG